MENIEHSLSRNDNSNVENLDSPVMGRKRRAIEIINIDSNNENDFETSGHQKNSNSSQNSQFQSPVKLARKSSLKNNPKMSDSKRKIGIKRNVDSKSQFGVKKPSSVIRDKHKTSIPQKHQQEWKGPDFDLNVSPLGVDNHLNSWIKTREKLEVMSANPTLEVDLHNHSQQLNDLYIDIHEKFHSILDKIPLKVLDKFPEFDPAVFNNLNTLKEHVQTKRIMTEEKIRQIHSSEHQESAEASGNSSGELSELDNRFQKTEKLRRRSSTENSMTMPSPSNDSYQSNDELNKVKLMFKRKFVEDIVNSGLTGEFDGFNYPFSKELMRILRIKFGLYKFRPNQLQVINAVLTGHDCFVLMPTGRGKSLCYQLPALLCKGVTIVITPSESLAVDHVQYLNSLNIKSYYLFEDFLTPLANAIHKDLLKKTSTIKLLYITRETILSAKFINFLHKLYNKNLVARFVVDEAHYIPRWGLDYWLGDDLRFKFPNVGITVLTATSSPSVCQDIQLKLGLENPKWFLASFNRPNLKYQIINKKGLKRYAEVTALIKEKHCKNSGIVYCFSRKACEKYAEYLKMNGIEAASYHGGLRDKQQREILLKWSDESIKVVCATKAFGMDIGKPNVRFVIHAAIPKSIEDYYQESSRAGRDGEHADCILFYNDSDTARMKRKIKFECATNDPNGLKKMIIGANSNNVKKHLDNFAKMVMFCENRVDCRRALLLQHYGESFDRSKCLVDKSTTCDNCRNQALKELQDQCYADLMHKLTSLRETINFRPSSMINPEALRAMSRQMPNTKVEMLKLSHMTEVIFKKYGKTCLEVTTRYRRIATDLI